jgi:hypothetical protein
MKGSGSDLFKVLSRNYSEGTEENHENFSQGSRSPGRDSNPGSHKYGAEVLINRSRLSVT